MDKAEENRPQPQPLLDSENQEGSQNQKKQGEEQTKYPKANEEVGIACRNIDIDESRKDLQKKIDEKGSVTMEAAYSYNKIGVGYINEGKHKEAQLYFNKTLDILQKIKYEGPSWGYIYNNLGSCSLNQDQFEQAQKYFELAFFECQKFSTLDPQGFPQAYDIINSLGNLYKKQHIKKDAQYCFNRAIELYSTIEVEHLSEFQKEDLNYRFSNLYDNLAQTYGEDYQADAAFQCYDKALQYLEPVKDSNFLKERKANINSNKAMLFFNEGFYNKALEIYKNSFQVMKELYGEDSSLVLYDHIYLAITYSKLSKLQDAKAHLEKSLKISLHFYGESHLDTYQSLIQLADTCAKLGLFEEASKYAERARLIKEKLFGLNTLELMEVYDKEGQIAYKQKNYDKARDKFQQCISLLFQVEDGEGMPNHIQTVKFHFGQLYRDLCQFDQSLTSLTAYKKFLVQKVTSDHPDIARCKVEIGKTLQKQGKFDEAIIEFKQAEESLIKKFGEDHVDLINCFNCIGSLFLEKLGAKKDEEIGNQEVEGGEGEQVIKYLTKALDLGLKFYDETHPDIAESYELMGDYLQGIKKKDEAIPNYEKSIEVLGKVFNANHHEVTRIQQKLNLLKNVNLK